MTFLNAAYMVVISIFTVGFKEVQPLTPPGQVLTMAIIVTGVGTAIYAGGKAVVLIVEGDQKSRRIV